jgi:hypothetical protein
MVCELCSYAVDRSIAMNVLCQELYAVGCFDVLTEGSNSV